MGGREGNSEKKALFCFLQKCARSNSISHCVLLIDMIEQEGII